MVALFIIIGVAALVGGMISESKKYRKMTPQQRREQEQKTMETFAGIMTGLLTGSVVAGATILKGSDDKKRRY